MSRTPNAGVTIIELLVAVAVMGVLVVVIAGALTPSMRLSIDARSTTSASATARTWMDEIKASWTPPENAPDKTQYRNRFDRDCVVAGTLPSGVTATVVSVTPANPATGGTEVVSTSRTMEMRASGSCANATTASTIPFKRVTVTSTISGRASSLTMDIPRP